MNLLLNSLIFMIIIFFFSLFRRGNPLRLSEERYKQLHRRWFQHEIPETIVHNLESSNSLSSYEWWNLWFCSAIVMLSLSLHHQALSCLLQIVWLHFWWWGSVRASCSPNRLGFQPWRKQGCCYWHFNSCTFHITMTSTTKHTQTQTPCEKAISGHLSQTQASKCRKRTKMAGWPLFFASCFCTK